MIRSRATLLFCLLLAVLVSACESQRSTMPYEAAPPEQGPYVIGAGDVLQVRVWRNEELSVEVPVRTDGKISVPLLNDVQAEGLTPEELRDVISADLSEYIAAPDVTVVVMQPASKRIYVIGAVARPGPYPILHDLRLLDALSLAGGLGPFANKDAIKVIRAVEDGSEQEFPFDYDAYVAGRAPGTNIVLQPGDTVVVPD